VQVEAWSTLESPRQAKPFTEVVERLCTLSVRKAHDAFRDIPWESPESQIDPRDPRFCLRPNEALGATRWYASLAPDSQAQLGLELLCQTLRFGVALENTMSRGLLEYARNLPQGSIVFRYALHEVIEESQHSLMFRSFIEQSGCRPDTLGWHYEFMSNQAARSARRFPILFFLRALAGEIFVDADNRARLAQRAELHPLVARIMQIHVMDEARHMRFAEHFVNEHWPRLGPVSKLVARAVLPSTLRSTARLMMEPSPRLARRFQIPRSVLREAYGPGTVHRERVRAIEAPVYRLIRASPYER